MALRASCSSRRPAVKKKPETLFEKLDRRFYAAKRDIGSVHRLARNDLEINSQEGEMNRRLFMDNAGSAVERGFDTSFVLNGIFVDAARSLEDVRASMKRNVQEATDETSKQLAELRQYLKDTFRWKSTRFPPADPKDNSLIGECFILLIVFMSTVFPDFALKALILFFQFIRCIYTL